MKPLISWFILGILTTGSVKNIIKLCSDDPYSDNSHPKFVERASRFIAIIISVYMMYLIWTTQLNFHW